MYYYTESFSFNMLASPMLNISIQRLSQDEADEIGHSGGLKYPEQGQLRAGDCVLVGQDGTYYGVQVLT